MTSNKPTTFSTSIGAKEDVSFMVEHVSTHPSISLASTTSKCYTSSTSFKSLQSVFGKPTKQIDFDGDDNIMSVTIVQSFSLEEQIDAFAKAVEILTKSDQEQKTQLTNLLNKLEKRPTCGATNLLRSMSELEKQTTPQETLSKPKVSTKDIQVSANGSIHAK
ncbi:hypothetical protein CsSME_00020367 [Camellia sinensis var. sinensis]